MDENAEPDFVVVCESEADGAEKLELPTNPDDGSLRIHTLMRAFPNAHGLKYKNLETGAYRALLTDSSGTVFYKPSSGWGGKVFVVIPNKPVAADSSTGATVTETETASKPDASSSSSSSKRSSPVMFEETNEVDTNIYAQRFSQFLRYLKISARDGREIKGCVSVLTNEYCVTNAHIAVQAEYKEYQKRIDELRAAIKSPPRKRPRFDPSQQRQELRDWVRKQSSTLHGRPLYVYRLDGSTYEEVFIVDINFKEDVVLMRSPQKQLLSESESPLTLANEIFLGDNYVILGLPRKFGQQDLCTIKGHVTCIPKLRNKFCLGAYGAGYGYSGGPVIRLGRNNDLIGIVKGAFTSDLPVDSTTREIVNAVNDLGYQAPLVNIIPSGVFSEVLDREEDDRTIPLSIMNGERLRQTSGRAASSSKQKRPNDDDDEDVPRCCELIILGLSFKATDEEVKEYFKQYGGLASLEIKRKMSGGSKGFGFLRMATFDGQMQVLKKANHVIGNRKCQVRVPNGKPGMEFDMGGFDWYDQRAAHYDMFPPVNSMQPSPFSRMPGGPYGGGMPPSSGASGVSGHHGSQILASGLETLNLNNMKPELVTALKALMYTQVKPSPSSAKSGPDRSPISLAAAVGGSLGTSSGRVSPPVFPPTGLHGLYSGGPGGGSLNRGSAARELSPQRGGARDYLHSEHYPPRRSGGGANSSSNSNGSRSGGDGWR